MFFDDGVADKFQRRRVEVARVPAVGWIACRRVIGYVSMQDRGQGTQTQGKASGQSGPTMDETQYQCWGGSTGFKSEILC